MSLRQLRSGPKEEVGQSRALVGEVEIKDCVELITRIGNAQSCTIQRPGSKLTGLSQADAVLLRRKERRLKSKVTEVRAALSELASHHQNSLNSTLIFAQESAGTAVCISPLGLVLTCAHCVAEDEEEYQDFSSTWLLFHTGVPVRAKCLAWDPFRDLALLQIITVENISPVNCNLVARFAAVPVGTKSPATGTRLYCIGQPGRDDLESTTARKTTYNLVEISHGRFRGNVRGVDLQDNSEIGNLKHDAWTYWGHSGAPLINKTTGDLVGLHSSWDDQTAMRHGVPLAAIREFLLIFVNKNSGIISDEVRRLLREECSITGGPERFLIGSSESNAIVLED